jgi:hypothetical protein
LDEFTVAGVKIMKQSIADIADRYTILCIKVNHGSCSSLIHKVVLECEEELKGVDISRLLSVNETMWGLEEEISIETDLRRIGVLCLTLRMFNLKRIEAKNKIARDHGEVEERKSY